jgi:hypothetical protein
MQEISTAPPGIYIDESDSDDESTDSGYTSTDSGYTSTDSGYTSTDSPPACDSSDFSFIDTVSDGKSLPNQSLAGYMMILKGYTLLKRTLKALPRNPETMQSRKTQHRFSQAYIPAKASAPGCIASTTPNSTLAPCSVDHNHLSKVMARIKVTDNDPPTAVSLSSHPTERDHSVRNNAPNLNSTTQGKRKAETERPVENSDCVRKFSCLPQTPIGPASSEALHLAPFPCPPADDSTRLHTLPMPRPGPSTFEFAPFNPDERHVPLSSNLIPQVPFPVIDGASVFANNISSFTSVFSAPEATFNPYSAAFHNPQQVLAEQPIFTYSGSSLSSNAYNGSIADPTAFMGPFTGPFTSELLALSPNVMDTSFPANSDVLADEGQLRWIRHSDVEMADVQATFEHDRALRAVDIPFIGQQFAVPAPEQYFANPSAGFDFAPVPIATAPQYVGAYQHPMASAFGGISTAVSALGPSSDGFSAIDGLTQSAFNSAIPYVSAGVEPSAVQSVIISSSQDSPSIIEPYTPALPMPVPEQPTEIYGLGPTNYSGPSEIPPTKQYAYETSTQERDIQQPAENIHTTLKIEELARKSRLCTYKSGLTNVVFEENVSPAVPKVEAHGHAASESLPIPNRVIYLETVVQPVGHDSTVTAPIRRMPQYIAPSAPSARDGVDTQADDDDDTKTEPDDCINENDVNADILAHAILNIPLPPSVVASVQVLSQRTQRKRSNSNCRDGIARMRARRRQLDAEKKQEDGNGSLRGQRTRLNHSSRASPYGSVTRRQKGNAKTHERWGGNSLGNTQLDASAQSDAKVQTSGVEVEAGNTVQSRAPFNSSIINRDPPKFRRTETTPSQPNQGRSTAPTSSLRRSREDNSQAEEHSERGGSVKRTRFRGSAEETRESAQPSEHPAARKRPAFLRRAAGCFGSAGRGSRPTNGGVQARHASGAPAARHAEAARLQRVISARRDKGPTGKGFKWPLFSPLDF